MRSVLSRTMMRNILHTLDVIVMSRSFRRLKRRGAEMTPKERRSRTSRSKRFSKSTKEKIQRSFGARSALKGERENKDANQLSHTHVPPTIVLSTGMLISSIGSTLNGSCPRTTRSASLPGSIEPLLFSS